VIESKQVSVQTWAKTAVQCLVRHSVSGVYYARTRVKGKLVWKTLETDIFQVAKARLPDALENIRKAAYARNALVTGYVTFGEAADVYILNVERKVDLKPRSVDYQREIVQALLKSWPELETAKLKAITADRCMDWASKYATRVSPSRFNNTVDALRKILDLGIVAGLLVGNPAASLSKITPRQKKLELPTKIEFGALVRELRSAGGWCSIQCADLVEFLAYSGARIGEARTVTWADIHLDQGVFWIHGDPVHGTKNRLSRQVPIVEPMERLLVDLRDNPRQFRDPVRDRGGYVLVIRECQKAIDRACENLGLKRVTHHDFRHLFATACIESGVDIPTVSRWLGHKDGGALAMKTYGHLRDSHSLLMAKKVAF
jgi:integrase